MGSRISLGPTTRVEFARYINQIHNVTHPVYYGAFLASLDEFPYSHPMGNLELKTLLELVLSQTDGHIVRIGVVRTSGVTAFDIGALESVARASPFGAAPPEIVSPDGSVYLHWEFHRRPEYACSTYFARPYILGTRPESARPGILQPHAQGSPAQAGERLSSLLAWKLAELEQWRGAVENYVPSVRLGTRTDLDGRHARTGPFVEYANQIHNRVHPVFSDTFLASLDAPTDSSPMSSLELATALELVLSGTDGHIVRMGVVRPGGVMAFDTEVLESVKQASPFGPAPSEIVSPDGSVYLHWEFHRRPEYACSPYFAKAYVLEGRSDVPPSNTQRGSVQR
jgi:hypothetical protein